MSDIPAPDDDRKDVLANIPRGGFNADMSLPPLELKEIMEEIAPVGEQIPAEELIDKTFTIVRARPVESSYGGQTHFYFTVGQLEKEGTLFNTVLGGGAVLDVLDAWSRVRRMEPLRCTLKWNTGGKYKGYYTLE